MEDQELIDFITTNYSFSAERTGHVLTLDDLHAEIKRKLHKSYFLNALVKAVHQHAGVRRLEHVVHGKKKLVWFLKEAA